MRLSRCAPQPASSTWRLGLDRSAVAPDSATQNASRYNTNVRVVTLEFHGQKRLAIGPRLHLTLGDMARANPRPARSIIFFAAPPFTKLGVTEHRLNRESSLVFDLTFSWMSSRRCGSECQTCHARFEVLIGRRSNTSSFPSDMSSRTGRSRGPMAIPSAQTATRCSFDGRNCQNCHHVGSS